MLKVKHKSVGTKLSQDEWEASDIHEVEVYGSTPAIPLDLSAASGFAGADSSYEVSAIVFNGRYWLVGGIVEGATRLVKWDGATWTDLTGSLINFDGQVLSLAWCGTFWLIGGSGGDINKWNETTFTDLKSAFGLSGVQHVWDMKWNGSYALVVAQAGPDVKAVQKYDGTTVTDLSGAAGFTDYPDSVGWNGRYWLVGAHAGELKKYDGSAWIDLSSYIQPFIEYPSIPEDYGTIDDIAWNGYYWLLGSFSGNGSAVPALVKWDEHNWTNLSGSLVGMTGGGIKKARWNGITWLIIDNTGNANLYNGQKFTKLGSLGMNPCVTCDSGNGLWLIGGTKGKLLAFQAWGEEDQSFPVPVSGLTLQGSSLDEATTTSTTEVELLSVTGLNIPTNVPMLIIFSWRKTSGAAYGPLFYLYLNTTNVSTIGPGTATNQNENGIAVHLLNDRVTSYLTGGLKLTSGTPGTGKIDIINSNMPATTITQIVVKGKAGGAGITVGVARLRVYTLQG